MTERLRAVLDTNVIVSAYLSRSPTSPTQELIDRWLADEFTLLICDAIVDEFIEKLIVRGVAREDIEAFVALLDAMAEWVDVPVDAITRRIPGGPDEDVVIACALARRADFLVTYDPHFSPLGETYEGIRISKALPFLWAIRGDQSPEAE